ncbi:histidine phosphatase family protein [Haloarcula sp. CBA1130]|uniref:histidine phosphatase family protein n=1 Tax=unclassified Haloarcula TaxID=2624677 RepID=UPI001243B3FA|nr:MULTISPECIES: histidine phosphatase family protein [unclassified Haloarcula]KAA9399292.1 histidine phosphatase family protein [Haloarcula sp. CBA1129]KAA9403806.1 histidine phosphatase family protein [Haloarcula sp. CBA1130]
MGTLLVARHGETTWNRDGRIQGWAPSRLTDQGQTQAIALGSWLDDRYTVDRVFASDLRRTRETAAAAGDGYTGLPDPEFDTEWRERGFGIMQGLYADELLDEYPDHQRDASVISLDASPEGGEGIPTFRQRVESAWQRAIATTDAGETTLVVTHGGVIKVLLAKLTGKDPDAALAESSQANCAVNEIRLDGDDPELVGEELTGWRSLLD